VCWRKCNGNGTSVFEYYRYFHNLGSREEQGLFTAKAEYEVVVERDRATWWQKKKHPGDVRLRNRPMNTVSVPPNGRTRRNNP
jgi:hypothetical protein